MDPRLNIEIHEIHSIYMKFTFNVKSKSISHTKFMLNIEVHRRYMEIQVQIKAGYKIKSPVYAGHGERYRAGKSYYVDPQTSPSDPLLELYQTW